MNFNSILIGSEDPQRLVDYYTKLFGQPSLSDGGYTGWQIGSGFVTVGPHSEVKGQSTAATEVSRLRIPEESSPASLAPLRTCWRVPGSLRATGTA